MGISSLSPGRSRAGGGGLPALIGHSVSQPPAAIRGHSRAVLAYIPTSFHPPNTPGGNVISGCPLVDPKAETSREIGEPEDNPYSVAAAWIAGRMEIRQCGNDEEEERVSEY